MKTDEQKEDEAVAVISFGVIGGLLVATMGMCGVSLPLGVTTFGLLLWITALVGGVVLKASVSPQEPRRATFDPEARN